MLGGIIFDGDDTITDLRVVMESRMSFSRHIDVTIGKVLAILGLLKIFGVTLILLGPFMYHRCPILEYASAHE
jgi:hypothetical protein